MSSGKASVVMAAKMLDFVREMSLGTEDFTQRQSDYWIFVLQEYPPHCIEQAFHQWVKKSKHMPVPSEIIEILDDMIAAERRAAAASETTYYLNELRETRRRLENEGLPYGQAQFHSILRKAVEIAKNFPEPPDATRAHELKERFAKTRQTPRKPVAGERTIRRKTNVSV